MIDYFLKFADENAALTALQNVTNRTDWPLDYAIPGLQFWRDSQDNADGSHNYLAGFFVLISLPNVRAALLNAAAVQVVIDHELAKTRTAGAVLKSGVTTLILQDLRFQPVPAGADIPYGNMQ